MNIPRGERAHYTLINTYEEEPEHRKASHNSRYSKIHIKFEHLPRTNTSAFLKTNPRKFLDQISASPNLRFVRPNGARDHSPIRNRVAIQQLRPARPMPHNPSANQVILVKPFIQREHMFIIGKVQETKIGHQRGDPTQSLHYVCGLVPDYF